MYEREDVGSGWMVKDRTGRDRQGRRKKRSEGVFEVIIERRTPEKKKRVRGEGGHTYLSVSK